MPENATDLPFAVPEDSTLHELEEADQAHDRDLDTQPFPADPMAIRAALTPQRGSSPVRRPLVGNGPGGERGDLSPRT